VPLDDVNATSIQFSHADCHPSIANLTVSLDPNQTPHHEGVVEEIGMAHLVMAVSDTVVSLLGESLLGE
jgi:hypothetical protein